MLVGTFKFLLMFELVFKLKPTFYLELFKHIIVPNYMLYFILSILICFLPFKNYIVLAKINI